MDPGSIATAAGDVGAAWIQSNAQESIANQQAQDQADLQAEGEQTQINYANTEENALRNAISGVTAQGNPYMLAKGSMAPPTFAAGGTFGATGNDPVATGLTGGAPAAPPSPSKRGSGNLAWQ